MRSVVAAVAALGMISAGCGDIEDEPDLDTPRAEERVAPTGDEGLDRSLAAALDVDSLSGVGEYLTDQDGRALYLLEGEPRDSSTCYDACAEEWPPYLAEGTAFEADGTTARTGGTTPRAEATSPRNGITPQQDGTAQDDAAPRAEATAPRTGGAMTRTAGSQIQQDRIGTIEREDGQMQITYDGHPLYYYHDDQGPGSTTGQDVTDQWGEWYLVTPTGEPLEGEEDGSQGER